MEGHLVSYSRDMQDFREMTFKDSFPQVLRESASVITSQEFYPFIRDDKYYWAMLDTMITGKSQNDLGFQLKNVLKIVIDTLFKSRYCALGLKVPDEKKKSMHKEASELYSPSEPAKVGKLFMKKVLGITFPSENVNLETAVFYKNLIKPALKGENQHFWDIWVSVWLFKTSIVRVSTMVKLSNFLAKPSVQPLLHVKWFHDSIIQPVEVLTKYFIDDLQPVWTKDKRKSKVCNFLRALCLEHFLTELTNLPLPFLLDKNPNALIRGTGDKIILHPVNGDLKASIHIVWFSSVIQVLSNYFCCSYRNW